MSTRAERAVEKAKRNLERLGADVEKWTASVADRRRALAEAEEGMGAAVVDAEDQDAALGATGDRVASLQAELRAARDAEAEVRRRRGEAHRAVWLAEAAVLREQAADLRRQADEHEQKTLQLLAELETHERVAYAPVAPERGSRPMAGELRGGAPSIVVVPTPWTQILRTHAAELDAEAEQLESRTLAPATKHVDAVNGRNLDELLGTMRERAYKGEAVPLESDVRSWADEQVARLRATTKDRPFLERNLMFELAWSGGELDRDSSKVSLQRVQPYEAQGATA